MTRQTAPAVDRNRVARLIWLASLWLERGHPHVSAICLENAASYLRRQATRPGRGVPARSGAGSRVHDSRA
jgi:hypothetical protein